MPYVEKDHPSYFNDWRRWAKNMIDYAKQQNMKKTIPFDIEKAKAGYKVVNGMGQEVEIVKWDMVGQYPIVGIVQNSKEHQTAQIYDSRGRIPGGYCDEDTELRLIQKKRFYIKIKGGKYVVIFRNDPCETPYVVCDYIEEEEQAEKIMAAAALLDSHGIALLLDNEHEN